jgi:hypothetical protein
MKFRFRWQMNITEREHTILSGPLSRTTSFRIAIRGRMCKADVDRLIEKITAERDNLANTDDPEATPRQAQTSIGPTWNDIRDELLAPPPRPKREDFQLPKPELYDLIDEGGEIAAHLPGGDFADELIRQMTEPGADYQSIYERHPVTHESALFRRVRDAKDSLLVREALMPKDDWIVWEAEAKAGIAACKTNGELLDYEQAIKSALATAPAVIADGVKAAFAKRRV